MDTQKEEEGMVTLVLDQPISPKSLDSYTVDITDEWETSQGCGFTGDLLLNGRHIASFENNGDGGCNRYLPVSGGREDFRAFCSLTKEQFPNRAEPEDYALIYLELRDA